VSDIGIGIVGLGIGRTRAELIAKTPGAKLVAVADQIEERRADAKRDFGVDAYDDFRALFDRDDIDVIAIYTPAGTHMDMTLDALSAGKHVITTKAMEINIERCDRMIEAADKAGLTLMVDFESRYLERNLAIKHAIDTGRFGKLLLGEARMKNSRDQAYYGWSVGWRGTWRWDGGGSLANQTVHFIDRLAWFMGEPASVHAYTGVHTHQIEAEDMGVAIIKWKNGAYGSITGTTTTVPDFEHSSVEIHGDRGGVIAVSDSLKYDKGPSEAEAITRWIEADDLGKTIRTEHEPIVAGPANVIEDMVAVLTKGTEPAVSGREGRKSVEILNGIYQSSQTGSEVTFPLKAPFIPEGGLTE
jgi:UDP-N-acetyl-2-amino-2-deoxyglucuronate dehydrogenase